MSEQPSCLGGYLPPTPADGAVPAPGNPMDDDRLVAAAGDVARAAQLGQSTPASVTSLLRAIALTRSEADRHRLAADAERRAGQLGVIARDVLRVAIFALIRSPL